ncbi:MULTISPECIES: helix-turn-helix domain-containing protein [Stenotrophomonas]|uniref:helix-turn-helix domain-containing protein n=1 Tax=Stenotrophomonas TaxID=40323 RepID=UPI0009FDC5EE|nr:helix-turn-helix transcriptional regulator [Stenotrophomonas sp. SKA14]
MTTSRPLRTAAPSNPRTQGERIRFARISANLSQEQLGMQVNKAGGSSVTKSLVSQWERDGVKNPTNDNLFAIEAVTGFSAQWISSGRGPQKAKAASTVRLDTHALERALAAALPDNGKHADLAQVVAGLYDVLMDTPDVSDKTLASFASALARRI